MSFRMSEQELAAHMAKFRVQDTRSFKSNEQAEKVNASKRQRQPRKQPRQDIVFQCKALGLPVPVPEFKFHPSRKWPFDWAWPDLKIALEQEGIVYPTTPGDYKAGGRHASVSGFTKDIEKYGHAFALGWRVLRCLPKQIENGTAIKWLEPMLRMDH